MRTVEIRLTPSQFTGAFLMEMRGWLDRHRYEPHKFVYELLGGYPVVYVDFKVDSEAEEFAAAFGGDALTDWHVKKAVTAA
jgi:hypothetical protein